MTILVTGGAGYIGSHVVKLLGLKKEKIVILDNFSTGNEKAVLFGKLVKGDLADEQLLRKLFEEFNFSSIIHFAGSIVVPESVTNPIKYYQNNTLNSLQLIRLAVEYKVKHFIFSSTAAVYGLPEEGICREDSLLNPINPYGESKLMTEMMLKSIGQASDLRFVILRYFNVAGADPEGQIGQSFPQATHLIKVAAEAALRKRANVQIFGTDYSTPDGTGVRDYIHVMDLSEAHLLALDYLRQGGKSDIFNCGYSQGMSVKEILHLMKKISGCDFPVLESGRRVGDPGLLIAEASRIKSVLGFHPQYQNIEKIIYSALNWEKIRTY